MASGDVSDETYISNVLFTLWRGKIAALWSCVLFILSYIYIFIIAFTVSKALHFIISALKLRSFHKMPKFQALVSVVSVQSEGCHTIHKMSLSSKAVDPHKHAYLL